MESKENKPAGKKKKTTNLQFTHTSNFIWEENKKGQPKASEQEQKR